MPPSAGVTRFDHCSDAIGMGLMSRALIMRRALEKKKLAHAVPDMLNIEGERSQVEEEQQPGEEILMCLSRAVQLKPER